MNRRAFLKRSAQGLGSVAMTSALSQFYSSPVFAQQGGEYRALICLFLDGGLDSNDLIVPLDSRYDSYASVRRNLAVPQAALNPLRMPSDKKSYGLHSLLPQTASLFNDGQAAILANVGTIARPTRKADQNYAQELPTTLFSHPSQVGAWETAVSASAASTGWAGRVADQLLASGWTSRMPAVISTNGYGLLGQGINTDQITAASDVPNSADLINTLTMLQKYFQVSENGEAFNNIQSFVAQRQSLTLAMNKVVSDAYAAGNVQTTFPNSQFGQQLQIVSKLIAGRHTHSTNRQIFAVRLGGFDTHDSQVRLVGDRFRDLDAGLTALVAALKEIGIYQNVTIFTCSDFGRSLVANGTDGTDHGWGSHHMVLGGAVKGGDLYGTFPNLQPGGDDDTNQLGIWIPTTSTSQYLASMANWLGVPSTQLGTMFPELCNFSEATLPLFKA